MVYFAVQNFMIQCQAVPVLQDLVVFYKMADSCRPEVVSDVISGQKVEGIEVNLVTKFHDPSSNRLRVIKFAHSVTTTATMATAATAYASHPMNAPANSVGWLGR